MERTELKRAITGFLLVSEAPVQSEQVMEALGIQNDEEVRSAFAELASEFENLNTGLRIIEVAGGYRLATAPELATYLKRWFKKQKPRLSKASLETLSIIAYKQPVTRSEVEAIRGVNVEGALSTLLDRGLIRIAGRRETVGRPILYGTTRLFLEHFGLNTLKDLPVLDEFSELDLTELERQRVDNLASGQAEGGMTDSAKDSPSERTEDSSDRTR